MLKVGGTYQHKYNEDVCFQVISLRESKDGYALWGLWYSLSKGKPNRRITDDHIFIKSDQVNNWRKIWQ